MIRAATLEDISALATLHADCFSQVWSAEAFGRLLATPGAFALIAGPKAAPAGFILMRVAGDEAEILSLGVSPPHRRKGLGAELVCAGAGEADHRGARTVFLEVAETNAPAAALYNKLGFREAGRRTGYYREPGKPAEDALTLKAALPLAGEILGNCKALD